ncbi:bifunctional metallophosphatase/5'-nucleotidase [Muribaculaceae bacterium Isolate-002 (NCI)]|nr:bifunctional metallophosphatase/5'-nucleotidase [Muribaculaceae bacterium Isolate-002 (NCI)]
MKRLFMPLLAAGSMLCAGAASRTVEIKLIETSDVHGNYYPEDFINRTPSAGSLARVCSYVDSVRGAIGKEHVVLLDNGDILQGQPTVYYYNFIDTASVHIASAMMDYMGYDAGTIGNHDVETGHAVYDRWAAQKKSPTLGANVISTSTGEPYLPPYAIIERDGVKIAVLGLLTPAIPGWLPENLWSGLRFDDMEATASKWIDHIKKTEKPDLTVGLFHSGRDSTKTTGNTVENASLLVARHVPGFDIVMMGHDHSPYNKTITNDAGEKVIVVNPANNARRVATVTATFEVDDNGEARLLGLTPELVDMDGITPDEGFMAQFAPQREAVEKFVSRRIGHADMPMSTRDAYFGPSPFMDFIHRMQLAISGADISFAAPLSFDATINSGDIHVSDMFNLYKYENMLYTMALSGKEIKDYLEMSYDLWSNTMKSADEHLLRLRDNANSDDMTHTGFRYPSYNFDSAAGIIYTVDVTKPRGEKITIVSMADGSRFEPDAIYKVAINSYRGNGGGNLLTQGAGIAPEELSSRILDSTDKDLRYYLMEYIINHPEIKATTNDNWQFTPRDIVEPAAKRDRELLFGK